MFRALLVAYWLNTGLRIERIKVQVPLAAEIYWVHSALPQKFSRRFFLPLLWRRH